MKNEKNLAFDEIITPVATHTHTKLKHHLLAKKETANNFKCISPEKSNEKSFSI